MTEQQKRILAEALTPEQAIEDSVIYLAEHQDPPSQLEGFKAGVDYVLTFIGLDPIFTEINYK